MDLKLKDKLFIVCGATSGFGLSIYNQLIAEGAKVIAIARTQENLDNLVKQHPAQTEILTLDITLSENVKLLYKHLGDRKLDGLVINAGGPPAKKFIETQITDWDFSYNLLLRWKVEMLLAFLPHLQKQQYGRIVMIESAAVKQPLDNLILSNSIRLAVVGMIKSISNEIATSGVTLNILAPGYHLTNAVNRIKTKMSADNGITLEEAEQRIVKNIPVAKMGNADDFASLATWLLSPLSGYVNGQTISVDGGIIRGCFG